MRIVIAEQKDMDNLYPLVKKVWSSCSTLLDLYLQYEDMDSETGVMVAAKEDERVIGFACVCLRFEYVEGTKSSPVAYLEGVAVDEEHRGRGVAKKLVDFCEKWAAGKGCKEFASDCEIANTRSSSFHKAVGFIEAGRTIHFVKRLN